MRDGNWRSPEFSDSWQKINLNYPKNYLKTVRSIKKQSIKSTTYRFLTVFNVYGQQIDENYSTLLMERSDLPLEVVIWLDRVQKKHRIGNDQAAILRSAKLIEGRKPNFFVTAHVADATNTRPEYTRNKGLNDHYYKTLILQHIKQFKSVSVLEVRSLLLDKLPDSLTPIQKQAKVKNLLTALRMSGLDGQKIVATHQGKGGRWMLLKP